MGMWRVSGGSQETLTQRAFWANTESIPLRSTAEAFTSTALWLSLICSSLNLTSSFSLLGRNVNVMSIPEHQPCFLLSTVHLSCLCLARPSIVMKANDSFSVTTSLLLQVHLPPLQLGHSTVLSLIMSCLVLSLVGAKILTSHWSPGSTHEWDWNCEGGLNAQGKWNSCSEIETDTQSSKQQPEKPSPFCNT